MSTDKQIVFSIIGDKGVGKTSLLYCYTTDEFNWNYEPTNCEHYEATTTIENNDFFLEFWDTSANEEDDQARKFCVEKSHCFVVAFSLLDQNTFDNAIDKWIPFIKAHCMPEVKLIGDRNLEESKNVPRAASRANFKHDVIEEEPSEEDRSSELSKPKKPSHIEESKENREVSADGEGEGSDNSDTTINTGDAEFQVSNEKWNIVLVGTKKDLLKDEKLVNDYKKQGMYPVNTQDAENYALEHGVFYFETSSLLGDNISESFNVLIQSFYTQTDFFTQTNETSENIEEEDSEEPPFIPQINSNGFTLPFEKQIEKMKEKNSKNPKNVKKKADQVGNEKDEDDDTGALERNNSGAANDPDDKQEGKDGANGKKDKKCIIF
ncbi:unnamed protein product [Moneuplotes crassus]|uniref:Uncharacterized protein n=1 Tax=Euplotes crassus TaxID=5936 RepID=A0AAD1XFZ4_EUPCR|nr:unnamed protein product [Moneuplotes crassus]